MNGVPGNRMSMASQSHPVASPRIDAVRRFSRFYTKRIGVLQEGLLDSPFSLAEARVLYELAHRDRPTATALGTELGLDPGYLSRMLRTLEKRSLVAKARSAEDGRESFLSLTAEGRKAFSRLDRSSADSVRALLSGCSVRDQHRLVDAMGAIERILAPRRRRRRRSRCARTGPATSAGSSIGTAPSMRRSTGTTRRSKRSSPRSRRISCASSTRRASAAGSPRPTARSSARCFSSASPSASPSCACCWWSPVRADSASGGGWSPSASLSRVRRAIGGSRCGRNAGSTRRAGSTSTPDFRLASEHPHRSFGQDLVAQTWDMKL